MELNTKISETMSNRQQHIENKVIRMSKFHRQQLNVEIGEFITLDGIQGPITLQICPAYEEDLKEIDFAFVTRDIYSLLKNEEKIQEITVVKNVTLGTDPEFFIVKNGAIVNPEMFFNKYDMAGHDGMLAELRPLPDLESIKLTENLRGLLKIAKDKVDKVVPDTKLMAFSQFKGTTAGFHLHYGIPKILLNSSFTNKLLISLLVRVMDYYVAIPSIIPEGDTDSGRRCAPFLSYGKIGDYRIDERTLEYRVPGGNLLRHPVLTNGLIALGATVMEDALSRFSIASENYTSKVAITHDNLKDIYPEILEPKQLYSTVCVPNTFGAKKLLGSIVNDVRSMVSYSKRRNSIEAFFSNLETQFSNDLTQNWQLNN